MESLKKSKKKKRFLGHTEEQKNQLLVGMKARATRHQFNKRNCEIFINKIRWDTNVHILEYQIYRETLMISSFLYFIWKNQCQKQDSFRN